MKKVKEPSILVSEKQRANPVLKDLKLQHEFVPDLLEDFLLSRSISVLFLSLKYHASYPLYIKERLSTLSAGTTNKTKILLCLIDTEDKEGGLTTELQLECMKYDVTVLFCWHVWEVRNYLEWLSNTKKSQLGLLEEKKTKNDREKKVDALCAIPGMSQRNAESLLDNYGSLAEIILADYESFIDIEGIGSKKIALIRKCFKGNLKDCIDNLNNQQT